MTSTATDKDLSVMSWALAIIIAFFVLLTIASMTSLSDAGIAGWMAGLSTGTRVALAAFLDT
jgi:hypothetical protein